MHTAFAQRLATPHCPHDPSTHVLAPRSENLSVFGTVVIRWSIAEVSNCSFVNCSVAGDQRGSGGALDVMQSPLRIANCVIRNCTASGVWALGGACVFDNEGVTQGFSTRGRHGGGRALIAEISNTVIEDCAAGQSAYAKGGAIFSTGDAGDTAQGVILRNCSILRCVASGTDEALGGALCFISSNLDVTNSRIDSCGAVQLNRTSLNLGYAHLLDVLRAVNDTNFVSHALLHVGTANTRAFSVLRPTPRQSAHLL